jgi:nitric oxide dioxygenase
VHADRGPGTHALRHRLRQLATRLEQADIEIWYEEPAPGARHGRVDLSALSLPDDVYVCVCGPPRFLRDIQRQPRAVGIPDARVHIEQFTPADAGAAERVAR